MFPRPGDLEFIPLEIEPTDNGLIGRFELEDKLTRPDGALFGGTAIAASTTLMETATNAPALWITTQFVASAMRGETLTLDTSVVARGKRINQVQVNGRVGTRLVFTSLGSTALGREGGLVGQFLRMPNVGTPEDATPFQPGPRGMVDPEQSFNRVSEFRAIMIPERDKRTDGSMAMWARTKVGGLTPATISYLADMSPVAVARGAGKLGGGTSLDNSMRFGPDAPSGEWVLLEMHGHLALGGYGHASVHVWSEDGTLVGYGGQTANMRHVWAEADMPEEFRNMMQAP